MPFLSIIRSPWCEILRRTQRFSLSTQNRLLWRFGLKTRLVLLLACETLFPDITRFPVIWHSLAITATLNKNFVKVAFYTRFLVFFLGFQISRSFYALKIDFLYSKRAVRLRP